MRVVQTIRGRRVVRVALVGATAAGFRFLALRRRVLWVGTRVARAGHPFCCGFDATLLHVSLQALGLGDLAEEGLGSGWDGRQKWGAGKQHYSGRTLAENEKRRGGGVIR